MTDRGPSLRLPGIWAELWRKPDPLLVEAGARGERLLADVRVVVTGLLSVLPVVSQILTPGRENFIALAVALLAFALAVGFNAGIRRGLDLPWIGFVTSAFDVTLVSVGLAVFLFFDQPLTATNSRVIFEVYFIAIAATSLRYDPRVSVSAGLLAVVQYLAIVVFAAHHFHLAETALVDPAYGRFDWSSQVSRIVVLTAAAAVSAIITVRSQRLRVLSTTDQLTGLLNRSWFDEQAAMEADRAQRYRRPFAVAMLDLDYFKPFNDTYGHASGDAMLRQIGHALRSSVRKTDLIARYGGEEFVMLLPEATHADAREKVEAIRKAVSEIRITNARGEYLSGLTLSAGVATFPEDGATVHELLDVADARLFLAKNDGRNRVVGRTG
ncbi:MAG: diguanylate cyclase [Gemmatimonadota bacterium]